MVRAMVVGVMAAAMSFGAAVALAEEVVTEIDLTSLSEVMQQAVPASGDVPLRDVAWMFDAGSPRVYASAIIGPSFGQLGTTVGPSLTSSDTIITGGGALGIAFERPMGQLRLEVEGMGRGTYDAGIDGLPPGFLSLHVTNNWSAMTNMWRDLMLSDSFGVYGGGGIGAGGYLLGVDVLGNRLYLDPATAFAWQAGGGVIWNITDRLTFDAGYRFYQIDSVQQAPMVTPNQFQSNEVMFTLRLYEPFRGIWR